MDTSIFTDFSTTAAALSNLRSAQFLMENHHRLTGQSANDTNGGNGSCNMLGELRVGVPELINPLANSLLTATPNFHHLESLLMAAAAISAQNQSPLHPLLAELAQSKQRLLLQSSQQHQHQQQQHLQNLLLDTPATNAATTTTMTGVEPSNEMAELASLLLVASNENAARKWERQHQQEEGEMHQEGGEEGNNMFSSPAAKQKSPPKTPRTPTGPPTAKRRRLSSTFKGGGGAKAEEDCITAGTTTTSIPSTNLPRALLPFASGLPLFATQPPTLLPSPTPASDAASSTPTAKCQQQQHQLDESPLGRRLSVLSATSSASSCSLSTNVTGGTFLSRTTPQRKPAAPIPAEKKDEAYYERRRKNNDAAKRSRDQRRQKEEITAQRAHLLEQENGQLRSQIALLRAEIASYRQALFLSTTAPTISTALLAAPNGTDGGKQQQQQQTPGKDAIVVGPSSSTSSSCSASSISSASSRVLASPTSTTNNESAVGLI